MAFTAVCTVKLQHNALSRQAPADEVYDVRMSTSCQLFDLSLDELVTDRCDFDCNEVTTSLASLD